MRSQRFVRRVESFKIPNKVQVRWPIKSLSRLSKMTLKDNRTKEQWVEGITGRRYNVIMIIRIIQYTKFGVPAAKMTLIFKKHGWKRRENHKNRDCVMRYPKITHHHKNHKTDGPPLVRMREERKQTIFNDEIYTISKQWLYNIILILILETWI